MINKLPTSTTQKSKNELFRMIVGLYVNINYICTYKYRIMDSKLTLKLNKSVIERAKQYAKENNISLSKMIENYLQAVTIRKKNKIKISPLVESLTGVIELEKNDYRKDYTNFLSQKYS